MKEYTMIFNRNMGGVDPSPEEMQKMTQKWIDWVASISARNALANTGNRLAVQGKVVRKDNVITDSLSVELKEAVIGYTILKVNSEAEALEIAKECPVLDGGGSVLLKEVIPYNA